MASFLTILEDIGKDIVKGVETAAKIPGVGAIPMVGPIVVELGTLLNAFEAKGTTLTNEQLSQMIQILAAAQAVKQTAGPAPATATVSVQ
jgi:hypothetical protein